MKKLAVIGGNGMLGSDVLLSEMIKEYIISSYDLPLFDIANKIDLEQIVSSNDIILNCAAYTAVDRAETESNKCFLINSVAVKNLGEIAKKYNKYVLHISTDFVFGDSSSSTLNEESITNPLGVYGKSKLDGEKKLIESGANCAILRVQWTYGKHGDNFISKIISIAQKTDIINVVSDQIGSPTPTIEVCKAIKDLIDMKLTGTYHFASCGYASRYEIAKTICNILDLKTKINPCLTRDFTTPAKRPLNSRFDCSKIDKILSFKREKWEKSLEQFISENFKHVVPKI